MHKYIVANYKMNGDKNSYLSLIKNFNKIKKTDTEIILCPPFLYVPFFENVKNVSVGAQSICRLDDRRSTGQVSPNMLKEFGVKYVLVGHVEHRSIGDNFESIAEKVRLCCDNGLTPILCIGDTDEQERKGAISKQMKSYLSKYITGEILFAYEPISAIDSGKIVSIERIEQSVATIKREAYEHGIHAKVLYGGGVRIDNYQSLLKTNIAGFLCGYTAHDFDEFYEIIKGMDNE